MVATEHEPETPEIPADISPDYANTAVENALASLHKTPDYASLANFLNSLREGYLIADVTGATGSGSKKQAKKGTRIRTIRATNGALVLPIFTSLDALRATYKSIGNGLTEAKGLVLPALDAMALIRTDRFAALELNPGGTGQMLLRKFVDMVLSGQEITAESLEK